MTRPGPRLAYRLSTPEALAWAEDYKARVVAVKDARHDWMDKLYDAHGIPGEHDGKVRGAFVRGEAFSGLAWPKDAPLPDGWFRPVKTPQLVRPKESTKAGKVAAKEMRQFDTPSMRGEIRKRFGMPDHLFAGNGLYTCGVRLENDGVWVTWASRDVEDELNDPKVMRHHPGFEGAGWVRVPLAEYIVRFGEDAL